MGPANFRKVLYTGPHKWIEHGNEIWWEPKGCIRSDAKNAVIRTVYAGDAPDARILGE